MYFNVDVDKTFSGVVNKSPLNNVMKIAIGKAPLPRSPVFGIEAGNFRSLLAYLCIMTMKFVIILVIFYQSTHQNKSNYISLFIALYFYLTSTCIDNITLLNHLGFLVSYDVL